MGLNQIGLRRFGPQVPCASSFSWSSYWAQHLYDEDSLTLRATGRDDLTLPASVGDTPTLLPSYYKKPTAAGYAKFSDNGVLDIRDNDFTICGWVKSETILTTSEFNLFGKICLTANNGQYGIRANQTTGKLLALAYSSETNVLIQSDVVFNTSGDLYLRLDINQTTKKVRFFINRTQIGSDTAFVGSFPALGNDMEFYIGNGNATTGASSTKPALSSHSDTYIFHRILSDADDLKCYNHEAFPDDSDLVAHWPCSSHLAINDSSGNGYHLTMVHSGDSTGYGAFGGKYSMNNGYSLYKALPNEPVYLYIPYADDGSPVSSPSIPNTATYPYKAYTFEKNVIGNADNFNLCDALVRFALDSQWDRSNEIIWNDFAREDITHYDASNPTDWHSLELNQDNIDYWLNANYKDINIVHAVTNSVNQQTYLDEIYSWATPRIGEYLKRTLQYTNDLDPMFGYFTHEAAGLLGSVIGHPRSQYYKGKVYIIYQGNDVDSYIMVYTEATKLWSDPVFVGTNPIVNTNLGHCYPSILIDSSGYIHIFYGAVTSDIQYAKSTNPEDITAWTAMASPTGGTYPQPIQFSDGTIYLFHQRTTDVDQERWGYVKTTDSGANWGAFVEVFQEFAYWHFDKGEGDIVHATSCGYMTKLYDKPHIYYAKFDGTTWKDYEDNVLTPPVILTVTDIKIYDSGAKIIVITSASLNSSNKVYIPFCEGDDDTGICDHTYYLLKYEDGAWVKKAIGATTRMNNNGVPALIVNDDGNLEYYLISSKNEGLIGGNLEKWVSSDDGDTWVFDSIVIYGNILFPEVVFNRPSILKITATNYNPDTTKWENTGYLLGNKGLIKNYNGSSEIEYVYQTETLAYINGLVTPLSESEIFIIDNLVKTLKDGLSLDSLSDGFDTIVLHGEETGESGLRNLVKRSHDCTKVGAPTFTQFEGYEMNGTDQALDTNYDPLTEGVKFLIEDASYGIYVRTNVQETTPDFGCNIDQTVIWTRIAGDVLVWDINRNDPAVEDRPANTDSKGMYIVTGNDVSQRVDKNKVTLIDRADGQLAVYGGNFFVGKTATTWSSKQYAISFTGKYFTKAEADIITDAFEAFMDAHGKGVIT